MPELPEVNLFKLWLQRKIVGIQFELVSKCMPFTDNDQGQEQSLKSFNEDCPQRCVDVTSRGKELAIVFEKGTMVIQLSMGGFFGVRHANALTESPVKDLVNLVFKEQNSNQRLLLLEADQFRNFARIRYVREGSPFKDKNSPDILSEPEEFTRVLKESLKSERRFFKTKSLFEVLSEQRYFSGIGNYTKNEILERLHMYSGYPPWSNAYEFLSDDAKLSTLVKTASTYVNQMINWVGLDFDPLIYNQQKWLKYSSLFLRVYKKKRAKNLKVICYKIGGYQRCYSTCIGTLNYDKKKARTWYPAPLDIPSHWNIDPRPSLITEGSLNVGIFSWYSKTMLAKMHVGSNEDNVQLSTVAAKLQLEKEVNKLKRKASEGEHSTSKRPKKLPKIDDCLLVEAQFEEHEVNDVNAENPDQISDQASKRPRHKLNKEKRKRKKHHFKMMKLNKKKK